ncbi:membrane associated rhomboid family serine protease [Symbiobacterium terraclitae]|uniref:Membrane associated rhomboid family serine protease n=1 Tax=Symbiobacterium terraclitae TaxID=557451 RepID=A0ABS4JSJ9_9FIRM|nr:rhomboid family intramembrane serine protease [Symbiobacterium terraclitae]MBP2018490.1 membrane associated rhomboid family serine protease [Symbiobacterium terraclitae]
MVLPLRDSPRVRNRPWVNWALLAANIGIFLLEVGSPAVGEWLVETFALRPTELLSLPAWAALGGWPLVTLFASPFLHGSWGHVLGNMLYLWVFGDNIEERLGHRRYLVFYLLCAALSGIAHAVANPTSDVPTIGASGAVAGVLGGYIFSYPRARILTLVPVGYLVPAVRVPAWIFLGLWFLVQLASGLAPIWLHDLVQNVAFWAHINGFLSGVALAQILAPRRPVENRGG